MEESPPTRVLYTKMGYRKKRKTVLFDAGLSRNETLLEGIPFVLGVLESEEELQGLEAEVG